MNKFHLLRATALAFAPLLLAAPAMPRTSPKPVTLVVGFAAGGAADAAARLIAKKLGENIGQAVVVDNRAGAGGNIAHQQVANGPADGAILLFGSIGPLTIAPHVMKLGYDPFKDLAPVSGGVNFPNVLVVHKGVGVKTLAEFVALAKKKAGAWTTPPPAPAPHRTWRESSSTSAPGSRWSTCRTRAARRPCRTCWANASPPISRLRPRRCLMWKPAS